MNVFGAGALSNASFQIMVGRFTFPLERPANQRGSKGSVIELQEKWRKR